MRCIPLLSETCFRNVVSIFWNTFLALVAGGNKESAEKPIELGSTSNSLPLTNQPVKTASNTLREVKAEKMW